MRLLLAAHAFLPRSTAGVEVYTDRLARALQRRGHEVAVLAAVHDLAAEPFSHRVRDHGGVPVHEVVNVHAGGTLASTYDEPRLLPAVRAALDAVRPDVVHLQHLLNLPLGIVPLARQRGAAVLLTLHDHWLGCARDGLRMRADLALCHEVDAATCAACLRDSPYLVPAVQRGAAGLLRRAGLGPHLHRLRSAAPRLVDGMLHGVRRLQPPAEDALRSEVEERLRRVVAVARDVDAVLAPTRFVADRARELGVLAEVVPLGAVTSSRPRPAGTRRRFAYVGTLAPHKGAHVLVEAFRGVEAADATLTLHGSLLVQPAYVDHLRALAGDDARIRFAGPFAEGEQQRVLAAADALVVPSVWWENSPLTVLEAVAAGRVVVASATGGVPEILPAGAGVLTPPGDVAALRDVLSALCAGRLLADAAPAFDLPTVDAGAADLEARYHALRAARPRVAHG